MALTEKMKNKIKELADAAFEEFRLLIDGISTEKDFTDISNKIFLKSYNDFNEFIKTEKVNLENEILLKNKLYFALSLKFHPDKIKSINDSKLKQIPFKCLNDIYKGSNDSNNLFDKRATLYEIFLICSHIFWGMICRCANRYYYPLQFIVYFMCSVIIVGMMLIALSWLAVQTIISVGIFYENFLIDKFIFNQYKENLTEAGKKLVMQKIKVVYDYDDQSELQKEELLKFCVEFLDLNSQYKNLTDEEDKKKYIKDFCANYVTGIMHLRVIFESFISEITAPLPNNNLKNTCFAVFKRALQALLLLPVIMSIDATLQLIAYINLLLFSILFPLTMLVFAAVMAVINTPLYVYDASLSL